MAEERHDPSPPREDRRERSDPPSWMPVPDPTALTTEALHREIAALKEVLGTTIQSLDDLIDEKFKAVGDRFTLAEALRVEQKVDTQTAVNAALLAAKEAVREQAAAFATATGKSETAIKEQLSQITLTFTTALSGLNTQVDDLKARVVTMEAIKVGGQEHKAGISTNAALAGVMVGIVVSVITVIVTILQVVPNS